MGYTNSDLVEEIIYLSYEEEIIDNVRIEVKKILEKDDNLLLHQAYEIAYKKFSKKNKKKIQ